MKINQNPVRRRWLAWLVAVALLVGSGAYLAINNTTLLAQNLTGQTSTGSAAAEPAPTTIQPAALAQTAASAAGNLALVSERSVALQVDGTVAEIAVKVGDTVKAGDVLLKLETTDLERAFAQAQLAVETAKITLADLLTEASATEVAQAEAALVEAQENLASVQAGPSAAEIAAANSSLAAAQASYAELTAGPSDAELTQLSADLKKAEVALAEAQSAYDQIAWRNEAGMSSEAASLQSATIDYESAKAAYEQSTAAASGSELQSATSSIQSAQVTLDDLLNSPTAAELAAAQAQVAEAETNLDELLTGPTDNEVRSTEIALEQALIELEDAQRNLEAATVVAPIDGVVMELDAEVGVGTGQGTVVARLADPSQLEVVVDVAEADIPRASVGQQAEVEIDAFPGQTFNGVVQSIAPANDSDSSSVSYPVTIQLTDGDLTGVLVGMNAVATLVDTGANTEDSWLVPTTALIGNGDTTSVQVVRGTEIISVTVTPGAVQGEWTVVESPDLQAGDEAVGTVTSTAGESSGMPVPPDAGGVPIGGPAQ